jgi:uncharacterized protein (TIGR02147 family)
MNEYNDTQSIYSYDDFRLFLKHRWERRKKEDPSCTARSFAAEAGISNPGFLNDVIKGKRGLSRAARGKIARAFHLSPAESEYFMLLVDYGLAKKENVRQELYRQILFRRSRSRFARLNPAQSRYYADYRYPLVYNAIMACDFRGDYDMLAGFIYPAIPASHLVRYVRDLCEWGLVHQEADGRYVVTERFIEPPETLRENVRQLNREWIAHAMDALMRLPSDKRHISTMLLSVSPTVSRRIAEKLKKFREEIWEMVEEDEEDPSCVWQLNLQYLPRSRKRNGS